MTSFATSFESGLPSNIDLVTHRLEIALQWVDADQTAS